MNKKITHLAKQLMQSADIKRIYEITQDIQLPICRDLTREQRVSLSAGVRNLYHQLQWGYDGEDSTVRTPFATTTCFHNYQFNIVGTNNGIFCAVHIFNPADLRPNPVCCSSDIFQGDIQSSEGEFDAEEVELLLRAMNQAWLRFHEAFGETTSNASASTNATNS